jgi:hypothetical protein
MVVAQQRLEVAGAPILRSVLVDRLQLLEALALGSRANGYREILFNHAVNISPQFPSQSREKGIIFSKGAVGKRRQIRFGLQADRSSQELCP